MSALKPPDRVWIVVGILPTQVFYSAREAKEQVAWQRLYWSIEPERCFATAYTLATPPAKKRAKKAGRK